MPGSPARVACTQYDIGFACTPVDLQPHRGHNSCRLPRNAASCLGSFCTGLTMLVLLKLSKLQLRWTVAITASQNYEHSIIQLATSTNHSRYVLTHSALLQLPATAIHDVSTTSITLQNTTAEPQTFEFSVPQGSDLTLSPHVAIIPAEGSLCVALRYSPWSAPAAEAGLASAAGASVAEAGSGMPSSDDAEENASKVSGTDNLHHSQMCMSKRMQLLGCLSCEAHAAALIYRQEVTRNGYS